jgi:hypothetical protein
MSTEPNPYAAPATDTSAASDHAELPAERIRREYLRHEASVQSIGVLYYLGGGVLSLYALGLGVVAAVEPGAGLKALLLAGVCCLMAAPLLVVGRGLRTLRPWVRLPVAILSIAGLAALPVGTLVSVYILYLVFGKKGAFIFSPEYDVVLRQTPHIKYRTSALLWILMAVLFAVLALAIVASVAWRLHHAPA